MSAGQLHFVDQARKVAREQASKQPLLNPYQIPSKDWQFAGPQSMPASTSNVPRSSGPQDASALTLQLPLPGYNVGVSHGISPPLASPVAGVSMSMSMSQSINQAPPPSLDLSIPTAPLTDFGNQLSPTHFHTHTSMCGHDTALHSTYDNSMQMLQAPFNLAMQAFDPQSYTQGEALGYSNAYTMPLHNSPVEAFMDTEQSQINMMLPATTEPSAFVFSDMSQIMDNAWSNAMLSSGPNTTFTTSAMPIGSIDNALLPSDSLPSNSDGYSYVMVNHSHGAPSSDGFSDMSAAVSPTTSHIRAESHSSYISNPPQIAASTSSAEELFGFSPEPEFQPGTGVVAALSMVPARDYPFASNTHYDHPFPSPPLPSPQSIGHSSSPPRAEIASQSPQESAVSSPTISAPTTVPARGRRRISAPAGVTPKTIAKRKAPASKPTAENKGRRVGPLRPEQREAASQIRKVGACVRCKFLKKSCDAGAPCVGCQASHTRLWQVPCTRHEIKDLNYFLSGFKADFERHMDVKKSIVNITGYGTHERKLYISHGYGFIMPITARETMVRDDSCFAVDWIEQKHKDAAYEYEYATHNLSVGAAGISREMVANYVDMHLDQGFENFVDQYFEGTPFVTELLLSIHKYWLMTKHPAIRTGLRLVIAYALTLHITLISGLGDEEAKLGRIDDSQSRYFGQTAAPVMINFQVKTAMAELWRDLMTQALAQLSKLYTVIFSKNKMKAWAPVWILTALILCVWEMIQFDCNYRIPEQTAVKAFCEEMETVPVRVLIGVFAAITSRIPAFQEFDATKHASSFEFDTAVCDIMTEVRAHLEKHESYMRKRDKAQFCRDDFDSLSNKFLSRLIIRA